MSHIFVSHSSVDAEVAERLAKDLKEMGHTVWLDKWNIKPGDCIVTGVQDGLSKCEVALLLMTPEAIASGWVDKEWKAACWSEIYGKKRIIPVLLKQCEIPLLLRTKSYVDFTKSYVPGFVDLSNALANPVTQVDSPLQLPPRAPSATLLAMIQKLQARETPLSQCVTEILAYAIAAKEGALEGLCRRELAGHKLVGRQKRGTLAHRASVIYVSVNGRINPQHFGWGGKASAVMSYVQSNPEEFLPYVYLLQESLSELEAEAKKFTKDVYIEIKKTLGSLVETDKPNQPVHCYASHDIYQTVIEACRELFIQELLGLLPPMIPEARK